MAKTFYTERDIEDLCARGVKSLVLNEDTVVTDQARERALKLGFSLTKENDQPMAAPVRPYVAKPQTQPAAKPMSAPAPQGDLEARILAAVRAKVGDSVDDKLLETIVKRVLQNLGGG